MKKIIPFSKEIKFNTKIFEINSISLENNLILEKDEIKGDFIISGDYKESDILLKNEPFIFNLPFNMILDNDIINVKFEIDDFSYSIINSNSIKVDINLLLNFDRKESEIMPDVIIDARKEVNEEIESKQNKIDSDIIINEINNIEEEYTSYHVYIYRENDNLDNICKKYSVTIDDLKEYNELDKLSIGSKLIIPVC